MTLEWQSEDDGYQTGVWYTLNEKWIPLWSTPSHFEL